MITIKNEYQAFGEKHFFYLETKLYEILNRNSKSLTNEYIKVR